MIMTPILQVGKQAQLGKLHAQDHSIRLMELHHHHSPRPLSPGKAVGCPWECLRTREGLWMGAGVCPPWPSFSMAGPVVSTYSGDSQPVAQSVPFSPM